MSVGTEEGGLRALGESSGDSSRRFKQRNGRYASRMSDDALGNTRLETGSYRTMARHMLPGAVLPGIIYFLAAQAAPLIVALAVASSVPVFDSVARLLRGRPPSPIGLVFIVITGVSIGLATWLDSPLLIVGRGPVLTGLMGIAFAISIPIGRPLTRTLALHLSTNCSTSKLLYEPSPPGPALESSPDGSGLPHVVPRVGRTAPGLRRAAGSGRGDDVSRHGDDDRASDHDRSRRCRRVLLDPLRQAPPAKRSRAGAAALEDDRGRLAGPAPDARGPADTAGPLDGSVARRSVGRSRPAGPWGPWSG